jgi:cytochrome d ubiquinol oxidase subunit II
LLSLFATGYVRPNFMDNYVHHKVGFLIPVVVAASLILMYWATTQKKDKLAFGSSCAYLAAMLVGAAFALYPLVLPASTDPKYSLSIYNSAAAAHGLSVGLIWWCIGMVLTLGYFFFIYRMFRGKVRLEHDGH